MPASQDHPFEPGRRYTCAVDTRHRFKLPGWELVELDGEWGEDPPPPTRSELEGGWDPPAPLEPRAFASKHELESQQDDGDWSLTSLDDDSQLTELDADDIELD